MKEIILKNLPHIIELIKITKLLKQLSVKLLYKFK